MTRRKFLDSTGVAALLLAAGWDVQTNGRVLCPVRGLTPVMSADQSRVLLPLRTGARTIIERGRTLNVERHPLASISDVTLLPFERSDLRNPDILQRAAGLIRSVGAECGILSGDRVMVRVNGITLIGSGKLIAIG